tara:strand:- start:3498 stop:3836 length:339 start_codon:yes stop_codon:yes gene_type:complete
VLENNMAKKKSTSVGSRRKRRSPEELIRDLEEKIRDVKNRQQAKELQGSPSVKRTLSIVKAIDKALAEAAEEGNNVIRHALSDARKPLEAYVATKGIQLPKARVPRGRKPKM